jgi:hypothetical protein
MKHTYHNVDMDSTFTHSIISAHIHSETHKKMLGVREHKK